MREELGCSLTFSFHITVDGDNNNNNNGNYMARCDHNIIQGNGI